MTTQYFKISSDGKKLLLCIESESIIKSIVFKNYNTPEYFDAKSFIDTEETKVYTFEIDLDFMGLNNKLNMIYFHSENEDNEVLTGICSTMADVYFCLYNTIMSLSNKGISVNDFLYMNRLYMLKTAHLEAIELGREEEAELLFDRIVEILESNSNRFKNLDPYPVINN